MAQDEGCFGRISRPQRCWAPPGIRPSAPAQVVREYLYVYAAVAPQKGLLTPLILPEASTAMMNLFLEHVSHTFSKYFIVMQVDNELTGDKKRLRSLTGFPHLNVKI